MVLNVIKFKKTAVLEVLRKTMLYFSSLQKNQAFNVLFTLWFWETNSIHTRFYVVNKYSIHDLKRDGLRASDESIEAIRELFVEKPNPTRELDIRYKKDSKIFS